MKFITKNAEPAILRRFREDQTLTEAEKNYSALGSYPADEMPKAQQIIKQSLLEEQGFICAYCMKRVETVRIEHWYPQNCEIDPEKGKKLSIEYPNFLGVCMGYIYIDHDNKSDPHCEANRGNILLTVDPQNQNTVSKIQFTEIGSIFSTHEQINKDLDITLNLNVGILKEKREKVWKGIENAVLIKIKRNPKINVLREELAKFKEKEDGKYREYCQVAIYYLQKELRKEERNTNKFHH